MRKAAELIGEYLREGRLSANRSQPIGVGGYGTVYKSDVEGNVIKDIRQDYVGDDGKTFVEREADLQAIAAELGLAPRVVSVETFGGGIGNRIEMQDMRPTHESHGHNARQWPTGLEGVRVNQQLGQLALNGVDVMDRHTGNILYNKMSGRPTQIDFGQGRRVQGEDQVATLANVTAEGFKSAGLNDVADIYTATVYDLLAGGDVAEAMDVAKQGFSRLQKISPSNYGSIN